MLTAVTGINWGDEGKGRVIDLLAENADVVTRYQGGNNAGHTVVTYQPHIRAHQSVNIRRNLHQRENRIKAHI